MKVQTYFSALAAARSSKDVRKAKRFANVLTKKTQTENFGPVSAIHRRQIHKAAKKLQA